jgi:4-diphosphocytidyl-2-C-methyl-D-erythritol kinase
MSASPISLSARAKLTLSLRVTGTRSDGFHLIDAEMVSLDIADVLTVHPDEDGLSIDGPFSQGLVAHEDNLVARALRQCGRRARVHIQKNIPSVGGLGGGSADAAAIFRWAKYRDLEAASRLGADIPFCMIGGRARVRGIGELIEPLDFVARTITLVIPPFGVSTPAVYRAFDSLSTQPEETINHLEAAALVVEPRLVDWKQQIFAASGSVPILAGSGSTWWLPGAFPGLVTALPEAKVMITQTSP